MTAWTAGVLALLVALAVVAVTPTQAKAATFVPLGTADSFAVLAGSAVTNTGSSVITGDVGVSPSMALGGFPPGVVVDGTFHPGDAVAGQAQDDLGTAYDFAFAEPTQAGISAAPVTPTLVPGTYGATAGLLVNGIWTLDAQNNPNAVWVFKIPEGLTTTTTSSIVLANGAQACNVFWVVGESATIQAGSIFAGTIMALTSITVVSGANIQGRALARNGAVTLDTNVITRPDDCGVGTTTTDGAATTTTDGAATTTTDGAATTTTDGAATTTTDGAAATTTTGDANGGDANGGDANGGGANGGGANGGDANGGDANGGDANGGGANGGDANGGDAHGTSSGGHTGGHYCDHCWKPSKPKPVKPWKPGHHNKPGKPDKDEGKHKAQFTTQ
ncbi:ice-binding family protein [Streptomyces sp. NPDC002668]|uniref:ice-binding family protein n=1 Tax=Streptomyces sp. NPDC002668 TaxID=3154422 RepID=UPI0033306B88